MAVQTRGTGGRPSYDLYDHRRELYLKAAPVLRTFGYRQVTMKALAHACGVSAPALYRYFPSKLDFALFPLEVPPTGYCSTVLRRVAAAHADPLVGFHAALRSGLGDIAYVLLAVRLAIEAQQDANDPFITHDLASPAAVLGELAADAVPALRARADDLGRTIASLILAAGATKEELTAEDLWRQAVVVLRAYLVDAGVDPVRFDQVFAG